MRHERVYSSNISSVGYDPETGEMEVLFLNGKLYVYYQVPPHEHQNLMRADSPGGHLFRHIIPYYRCTPLR